MLSLYVELFEARYFLSENPNTQIYKMDLKQVAFEKDAKHFCLKSTNLSLNVIFMFIGGEANLVLQVIIG